MEEIGHELELGLRVFPVPEKEAFGVGEIVEFFDSLEDFQKEGETFFVLKV